MTRWANVLGKTFIFGSWHTENVQYLNYIHHPLTRTPVFQRVGKVIQMWREGDIGRLEADTGKKKITNNKGDGQWSQAEVALPETWFKDTQWCVSVPCLLIGRPWANFCNVLNCLTAGLSFQQKTKTRVLRYSSRIWPRKKLSLIPYYQNLLANTR